MSNAAIRLLMRSGTRIPQDRLVQAASGRATGTGITVTFAGGAPDNTHLLVAVVLWNSASAFTITGGGWTEAAGGGTTGSIQLRTFARRGNGSINSITLSGANTPKTVFLYAFSGWVSDTELGSEAGNFASASSFNLPLSSPPAGYGVSVAALGTTAAASGHSWSNGYTLSGSFPVGGLIYPGRKEYLGSGGATTFAISGGGPLSARGSITVYPLTP